MGVKSLWKLLAPVGRPILLETVEGKTMAIDSSIWIYQFQATMRDKDGRVLVNAHILGFLRRITKLLFYGIKPVFVFDGGAPTLKKNTLVQRKQKKSGAAASHAKLAERLLAARLRKEALERTQDTSNKGKKKADESRIVYLEDVDPSVPKAPPRQDATDDVMTSPNASPTKRKSKFYDHDPYRLPELDLKATIAKATRSAVPDPRLATEEELRTFIEEMRPEDFDVTSPEFRELPTEIQYEIIGDLRLKSRQTSYARLEKMLQNSRTPMDFSKAQIQNLRQRNTLTQQLLITTDSIGKAHISIPVRIASERNKEYVLIKNEGEAGGWILGIRDHGTVEKPIVVDQDGDDVSSNDDMEEVPISVSGPVREGHWTEMIPHTTTSRPISRAPPPLAVSNELTSKPLFDLDDDDDDDDDNEALSFAVQASMDGAQAKTMDETQAIISEATSSWTRTFATQSTNNNAFVSPSRLQTVLSFANIAASTSNNAEQTFASFGIPSLLSTVATTNDPAIALDQDDADDGLDGAYIDVPTPPDVAGNSQGRAISVPNVDVDLPSQNSPVLAVVVSDEDEDMEEVLPEPNYPPRVDSDVAEGEPSCLRSGTSGPATPRVEISQGPQKVDLLLGRGSPDSNDDERVAWSRSPSPVPGAISAGTRDHVEESWDAAQEMDPHAEEGEFARFVSQVKGRDIAEVRREIDDEIESLNQQRKAAMRDSEDITQHTIAQIMTMLRLFGIPYITAPMEAEAQCAELTSLGLVDGVITDDSDVFLFGAHRVFKNMFNQSKTVECFLLSDLSRELGLDRDTLIRLAYFLGSDYVEGLPGIGPVVAMELLKEFPGIDGLHKFKDWWLRVQNGKDTPEDSKSNFRKRFKKKFKDLYLDRDWPNPAVRDAYYHPAVDSSEEPFKWGMPDLDGLRQFFQQELGWQQNKVDELLLPIIQKMNKRRQVNSVNKQSNLTEFFDVSAGMGAYVPKKRQAYTSKRLQDVVADFRKNRQAQSSEPTPESQESLSDPDADNSAGWHDSGKRKKRKTEQNAGDMADATAGKRTRNIKSKRVARARKQSKKRKAIEAQEDIEDTETSSSETSAATPTSSTQLRPRPRPIRKKVELDTVESQ